MSNQPTLTIPVIALRGLVIFPDMMIQFDVGRKKSVLALAAAMEKEQLVLLVSQTDLEDGEPAKDQLYRMGVVAKIKQVLRHSEEGVRLFAEGLYRAQIESVVKETPFLLAEVSQPEIPACKVTTPLFLKQKGRHASPAATPKSVHGDKKHSAAPAAANIIATTSSGTFTLRCGCAVSGVAAISSASRSHSALSWAKLP